MESTPKMVEPKIWLLCSKANCVPNNSNLAGALCVDESGLLMTTTFGVCPRTKSVSNEGVVRYLSKPEDFEVRAYDYNYQQWDVKLVYKCAEFGILFYQVVNKYDDDFDCVNLGNVDQEQFPFKNVFAYLHHNGLSYSTLSAIESYPFPPNSLTFADDVSDSIVARLTPDQITNLHFDTMDRDPLYRTVGNTINIETCNKQNVDADGIPNPLDLDTILLDVSPKPPETEDDILPEALYLYTELPLLQFSGLGCDIKTGSSGCSVFNLENNELVGLILFNLNSSCFAVPVSVLQHCFRKYEMEKAESMKWKKQRKRPSGSRSHG